MAGCFGCLLTVSHGELPLALSLSFRCNASFQTLEREEQDEPTFGDEPDCCISSESFGQTPASVDAQAPGRWFWRVVSFSLSSRKEGQVSRFLLCPVSDLTTVLSVRTLSLSLSPCVHLFLVVGLFVYAPYKDTSYPIPV